MKANMGGMRSLCLAGAGFMALAAAQDIGPSNATATSDGAITLTLSMGGDMVPLAPVVPLTPAAGQSLPPPGLTGSILLANATGTVDVDSRNIAAIDCDTRPGELQADYIFQQAVLGNASAVLFYSPTSERCTFEEYEGTYAWIYSMRSRTDTDRLLEAIDTSFEREQALYAEIAWSDTIQVSGDNSTSPAEGGAGAVGNDQSNNDNNNNQDGNTLGPSPTTAVAMIILYAITGIITALFLIIIITGAIRAHRHPERYGPRNIIGRPRQSRARGIARAMLDTLPIVKFGQRQDEAKPADVELAENQSADERSTTAQDADNETSQHDTAAAQQPTDAPRRQSTGEEGIAAAVSGARRDSTTPHPDNLGCSICTEDFEEGQDQRVLPCDHRFHPDCVDPWLLNVSGTCPLCRIDLHPPADAEQEVDENGNPVPRPVDEHGNPLPADGQTPQPPQRLGIRRSLLIGLIGSRSVDRMTQEERLDVLRQMRARRERLREANARAAAEATAQQPSQEDAGRVRDRLRRALGVRTSRTAADTTERGED